MTLTWPNLQDGTCKNSIQIEFQVGPECAIEVHQEASRPVSRQISELSPIFACTKKIQLMGNSPEYSPPPTMAEKNYIVILKL